MAAALFIRPMSCHAELGETVHVAGPDLDFDAITLGIEDNRVQGLIAVFFGISNVVVEFFRNILPIRMNYAQSRIAIRQIIDNHAHCEKIIKLLYTQLFALHFFPDTVNMLGTAVNLSIDVFFG